MDHAHPPASFWNVVRRTWLSLCVAGLLALPLIATVSPAYADTEVGNGKPSSENRTPGEFDAIGLAGSMALELRQGSPALVVVHGDSNLLPLLESVVDNHHALQLRWKDGAAVRPASRTWVEVTAPQIRAVSSAGSGDITIDAMKVARLAVSINGSGGVHAKALNNEQLSLAVAGSGSVSLAGRSTRLSIDLSGSSAIDAAEMRADDVSVSVAGSGGATVHAARTLAVSIVGSGDVTYGGEPTVQRAIAGTGQVRKR